MEAGQRPNVFDLKTCLVLLLMFIITIFCWDSPAFYPIKLFVVLLHELSHGLAAILTGGRISHIEINRQVGGVCYSLGGWPVIILCAGYIGSMLWGTVILIIASRTKLDNILAAFIGVCLLIITALYIRNGFGIAFTIGFAIALLLLAKFAPQWLMDLIMKFLGMTCCLYAIIDIKEDLIDRTVPGSDAYMLAKMIGLPSLSLVVGIFWIILSGCCFIMTLKIAGRGITRQPPPARGQD